MSGYFWGPKVGNGVKILPFPVCVDVELLSVNWALLSKSLRRGLPIAPNSCSLFASLIAYNGLWKKKSLPNYSPSPALTLCFFFKCRSHMALVLELLPRNCSKARSLHWLPESTPPSAETLRLLACLVLSWAYIPLIKKDEWYVCCLAWVHPITSHVLRIVTRKLICSNKLIEKKAIV